MKFFFEKIRLIFDIENWLWKYNFDTFWWTIIHQWILKKDSWPKINILKGNHCILRIRGAPVCQKMGMILENKVVQKLKLENNVFRTHHLWNSTTELILHCPYIYIVFLAQRYLIFYLSKLDIYAHRTNYQCTALPPYCIQAIHQISRF